MALLQHHLGDTEMEMIFSCMDSHGYLTPDQVGTDTALGPRQHRFYCYCYCYMVQDLPEHPVGSQRGSWSISFCAVPVLSQLGHMWTSER
jgi:hypothetical protein